MMSINKNKGFGLVGLTSFVLLIGMLCAISSVSSLRSAQGSIKGVNKLQTLAAAEGAMVLLKTGDAQTSSSVAIGNCVVEIQSADGATTNSVVLSADLYVAGKVKYSRRYQALVAGDGPMLEVLP